MASNYFSEYLLDLIEEDDRLAGLSSAIDIRMEEDPVNRQWVLTIAPRRDYPLSITPSTRYGVAADELDNAIRTTWGEIAQIAKDTNECTLFSAIQELSQLVPQSVLHQPSFHDWIPTGDPNRYESVRMVVCWEIDQLAITPSNRSFQLIITNSGFAIVDPHGKTHPITASPTKKPDETSQYTQHSSDNVGVIEFDIFDEDSMYAAFMDARAKGLSRLDVSQQAELTKLKKRTRWFSFLNGFTIFAGVLTFFLGFVGAHSTVPFLGPLIYTGVVVYAYNRD